MPRAEYDAKYEPDEDPDAELDGLTDALQHRATSGLFHFLQATSFAKDILSDGRDTSEFNLRGTLPDGTTVTYDFRETLDQIMGSLCKLGVAEMTDLGMRKEAIRLIHTSYQLRDLGRPS